jgi:hypothetical protein
MVGIVALSGPSVSGGPTPDAVVRDFYTIYLKIHTPGGLPDKAQLLQLSPFLSSRLEKLIVAASRYNDDFAHRHPGEKPPFVDGEFFSSNFEGATGFKVDATEKRSSSYRVLVAFEYAEPGNGKTPFRWKDAIVVVEERGRLVIDDVEFLGDWPFGNHGLLSTMLQTRD